MRQEIRTRFDRVTGGPKRVSPSRSITRDRRVSFSRLDPADGPPNEVSGLPRAVGGVAPLRLGESPAVICLDLTLIRTNRRAVTRHLFQSFDAPSLAPSFPLFLPLFRARARAFWACRTDSIADARRSSRLLGHRIDEKYGCAELDLARGNRAFILPSDSREIISRGTRTRIILHCDIIYARTISLACFLRHYDHRDAIKIGIKKKELE